MNKVMSMRCTVSREKHFHWLPVLALSALFAAGSPAGAARLGVGLSEILYDARGQGALELVELHNAGAEPVDLAGWSFIDGIRYSFDRSTVVPPGGFLLLARSRGAVESFYGLPAGSVAGEFDGALDNGGERLELVDALGRSVDELTYRDGFPFLGTAPALEPRPGTIFSLQRLCFEAPASAPFNWRAALATPGAPAKTSLCPPAPPEARLDQEPVVINEISYHPAGLVEPPLEFIELVNRTDREVDLSGWRFEAGISFTFPANTRLAPRQLLLIAQNPAALVAQHSLAAERVLGPFEDGSQLSNSGERLLLLDSFGAVKDEVVYSQDGAWPAFADGLGGTLQRVDPLGPSSAPGNWRAAAPPKEEISEEWVELRDEGLHEGPRVYLYLLGSGDALVDDLRLEVKGGDGTNYLQNGDFAIGSTGWSSTGNHGGSRLEQEGGFGDNGRCFRLKSSGNGDGSINGVRQTLPAPPPAGARMVLSARVKPISGESRFVFRPSVTNPAKDLLYLEGDARGGSSGRGGTPLAPNDVGDPILPATLTLIDTLPARPGPADSVVLRARVEGTGVCEAKVIYRVEEGSSAEAPLADDGEAPDAKAGDGVWTGTLPPAPDVSLVWFQLRAKTCAGAVSIWPPHLNPASEAGYYVHAAVPELNEELDLYYIFTPGALTDLTCTEGVNVMGSLVDARGRAHRNVGVKFRGETACGYPKRPIRVEFAKGDLLDGQRNLNFNAGWNDKSMIRERFAFDFFRQAGSAASQCRLARVLTNRAAFHGCYFVVEDPDERYARRNHRDPDGALYKVRTALLSADTSGLEPRTDSSASRLPDVREFANQLNRLNGDALVDHLTTGLDVEEVMSEQAVKVIIIDGDSVVKNWLLYLGTHVLSGSVVDKVSVFPWDLDLSYGQMLLTTDDRRYDIHPLFQTQTYPFHDQGYGGIVNGLLQRAPDDYFVKAYYGRMWHLLEEKFNPEVLLPKVDRYDALTREAAQADLRKWPRWGLRGTDLAYWRTDHRTFIKKRHEFLIGYLTTLKPTTMGRKFEYVPAPRLKFTEIYHRPSEKDERLEFVEIGNLEAEDVSLTGYEIPLLRFTFPGGAVIPARKTVLVAKDPAALREVGLAGDAPVFGPYLRDLPDEGGLLVLRDSGEDGASYPETIDVVVYDGDSSWPSGADGTGKSLELAAIDLDNDEGRSWRAGWSPGTFALADAPPRAEITVTAFPGTAGGAYLLSGRASLDPDGDPLEYVWELPAGRRDSRPALRFDWAGPEPASVRLIVRDPSGNEASADAVIGASSSPRFRRADASADGAVDLSDGVATLTALFLGGPLAPCPDAADANDDGTLDIADAVATLAYLFTGGERPPPPGPEECGEDPTPDSLDPCQPQACP